MLIFGRLGIGPDYLSVLKKMRKDSIKYEAVYCDLIPVFNLAKNTAELMQEFTQLGGRRPFGISLLIAGYDHEGPKLYQVDPSGAFFAWKASAIGKNATNAKNYLEKRYEEDMELEDAIHVALLTMKEGFEGEMTEKNVEIGIVDDSGKFRLLTHQEVSDYIKESA